MKQKAVRTLYFVAVVGLIMTMGAMEGSAKVAAPDRESLLSVARKSESQVLKIAEAAKKEKDFVRLNCVSAELSQVKGLLRVLEVAVAQEQEAAGRDDKELMAHEAGRIAVAQARIKQALAKANACKGEVAVYTGPVLVNIEVDPEQSGTAFSNPTQTSFMTSMPSLDRPQSLSPSM